MIKLVTTHKTKPPNWNLDKLEANVTSMYVCMSIITKKCCCLAVIIWKIIHSTSYSLVPIASLILQKHIPVPQNWTISCTKTTKGSFVEIKRCKLTECISFWQKYFSATRKLSSHVNIMIRSELSIASCPTAQYLIFYWHTQDVIINAPLQWQIYSQTHQSFFWCQWTAF